MQALKGYLAQLQAVAQQPHATSELSYHGALEHLLRTLRPNLTLVHEPTRTVVGRPDFALLHQHAPIGYVEAEAYAADLDNLFPHEVWAYRVGGYQVCHKWLDDRKGATLSYDERLTYQRMVTALSGTLALQAQIDAVARAAWRW
jgi:hypothetical protein